MKLVLELLGPPRLMGARRLCELRMGSLLIGRSPEADWVIPDSERMISRLHLRIDSAHGGFMLTDTSANGVYVNDGAAPVGYGASIELHDGDRLQVGDARIAVTVRTRTGGSTTDESFDLDADAVRPRPTAAAGARDPLGGPFSIAAPRPEASPAGAPGPEPAQPAAVNANWMIEPIGLLSPRALPGVRDDAQASPPTAATVDRGPADRQRNVPDLVDAYPGLSARSLATAVEAAARALDPSARSAFVAEIAASLARGR